MAVVDVVYIDIGVSSNSSRDDLVPVRVENSGGEVIHRRGVPVGLGPCAEDGESGVM